MFLLDIYKYIQQSEFNFYQQNYKIFNFTQIKDILSSLRKTLSCGFVYHEHRACKSGKS